MLLALVAVGGLVFYLCLTTVFADLPEARGARFSIRAGGFAAFGVAWMMHKPQLRAISTLGLEPRKPWIPVIAAILVAIAIHGVVAATIMTAA